MKTLGFCIWKGLGRKLLISIRTRLKYAARESCRLLLQIEAVHDAVQSCEAGSFAAQPDIEWRFVAGEENVGIRRWGVVEGIFDCTYKTQVRVDRPDVQLSSLDATHLGALPSDVTKFLMPSRYCYPEDFLEFVPKQFGNLSGGRLITKMADWINGNFTYDISVSNGSTTATDSFHARAGVCRDYAHVLIAMARAVGIPARLVSAYAPNVDPQDFHAIAEVFLDGEWHMVDPTGMTRPPEIVKIGVGRDAADVSFMTTYGYMKLIEQSVQVSRAD